MYFVFKKKYLESNLWSIFLYKKFSAWRKRNEW